MQPGRTPAFVSLIKFGLCAFFALGAAAQAADKKVDPTGTWTWTTPGRDGGTGRTNTLKLKLEGEKLTGALVGRARQGGEARETAIEDATLKGDEIAFKVVRDANGTKLTTKYNGKISGDTITGKTETERDGQARSRDWEAKRSAAKK